MKDVKPLYQEQGQKLIYFFYFTASKSSNLIFTNCGKIFKILLQYYIPVRYPMLVKFTDYFLLLAFMFEPKRVVLYVSRIFSLKAFLTFLIS